jgi:hypothetical protein
MGKFTNNPAMEERGELKEVGGKNAATSQAGVSHD